MSKDKDKKKDATKEKKLKRPREEDSKHPPSTTPLPLPSTTTPLESQKQTKQPTSTTSSTASTLASGEPKNKKIKLRHKNFIVPYVSPIASPKADETLSKVIFDSIKKANMAKSCFKGIKVIEKAFRKGEKGFVVLAADVYPMDIISHFPVLCEDYQVPYVFVNSKYNLSAALAIKRPVSALLISSKCQASLKETYDSCFKAIKAIQTQV